MGDWHTHKETGLLIRLQVGVFLLKAGKILLQEKGKSLRPIFQARTKEESPGFGRHASYISCISAGPNFHRSVQHVGLSHFKKINKTKL